MRANRHLRGHKWIQSRPKRIVDILLLTCLLPCAIGIAIVATLALLPRHRHRVFLIQDRVGRKGHLFRIHKLRTMPIGTQRLSRLGNVLATLGADETPQLLFTIWTGRMALIVPPALVPEDFLKMKAALSPKQYKEWYHAYTNCRPGWMGAFSRNSRLYIAQSKEYLQARHFYDTFYFKNACLALDVIILAQSLTMWCTPPQNLYRALKQLCAPRE